VSTVYQSFVERQKTYRKMDRLCRNIIYNINFFNIQFEYFYVTVRFIELSQRIETTSEAIETTTNYYSTSTFLRLSSSNHCHLNEKKQHERETISNLTINFRGHRTDCNFSCFTVSMSGQKEVLMSRGTSW